MPLLFAPVYTLRLINRLCECAYTDYGCEQHIKIFLHKSWNFLKPMEDESVKSLNLAARRGALVTVAAASALALASCSAGQVTQTSSQVAAVDGNQAGSANDPVLVRDVTVHLTTDGEAGVKFTAINQDTSHTSHTLESVTVDGEEVELDDAEPIERNCSLVADI